MKATCVLALLLATAVVAKHEEEDGTMDKRSSSIGLDGSDKLSYLGTSGNYGGSLGSGRYEDYISGMQGRSYEGFDTIGSSVVAGPGIIEQGYDKLDSGATSYGHGGYDKFGGRSEIYGDIIGKDDLGAEIGYGYESIGKDYQGGWGKNIEAGYIGGSWGYDKFSGIRESYGDIIGKDDLGAGIGYGYESIGKGYQGGWGKNIEGDNIGGSWGYDKFGGISESYGDIIGKDDLGAGIGYGYESIGKNYQGGWGKNIGNGYIGGSWDTFRSGYSKFDSTLGHGSISEGGYEYGGSGLEDYNEGYGAGGKEIIEVPVKETVYIDRPYRVDVPYPVNRPYGVKVPVPVDRPYPKEVRVAIPEPHPVPIKVEIPFPEPYPVEMPVPVDRPYPVIVEKKVAVPEPYAVEEKVTLEKPYPVEVKFPVPEPYPVTKEIPIDRPYPVYVEKKVSIPEPYPVEVKVPYPVYIPKPYPVEVKVPIKQPYPVEVKVGVPEPYPVVLEKTIPVPEPYTVERKVSIPKPYPVEVKVPVDRPYPVEVPKPYTVEKLVQKPVPYSVPKPVPYTVERKVFVDRPKPYPVAVPEPYPVPVKGKGKY